MACYYPLRAWRGSVNPTTGKRSIVFRRTDASGPRLDEPIDLPCGQCIGCRLEKSRQWAVRCVHEAQLHDENCFITLTYSDENLPYLNTLVKSHFQDFMKRLRERTGKYSSNGDVGIRYMMCGEYGSENHRPHYHAILFNYDLPDKKHWKVTDAGEKLYRSELLESTWGLGYCSVGSVTFESAAYVARYCLKKVTGPDASRKYEVIDESTGEVLGERLTEYAAMSRRPGLGKRWIERYGRQTLRRDVVVMRGVEMRPPQYYDQHLEGLYPDDVKKNRTKRARNVDRLNGTLSRLRVRETVKKSQLSRLTKPL